jgi:hypothetical protein
MATAPPPASRDRASRMFVIAALVAITLVLIGFARTYYLKYHFGTPALTGMVHLHGAVMTLWFLLFAIQATLIRHHQVRWHRRLGVAGVGLAILVVALGSHVAISSAARGGGPPMLPPLVFLAIPLGDMLVFTVLAGSAIGLRKRSDWHKRLMLLASLSLLAAAVARIPLDFIMLGGPLAFFGLVDLLIVACVIHDTVVNRRLHPAFGWGLLLIVASQVLRLLIAGTDGWMRFAMWLTGTG